MKKNARKIVIYVSTVIVIGLFSFGGYLFYANQFAKDKTVISSEQNTVEKFEVNNTQPPVASSKNTTVDNLSLKKNADGTYVSRVEFTSDLINSNNEFTAIAPLWTASIPDQTSLDIYLNIVAKAGESGWIKVERGEGKTGSNSSSEYFPEVPVLYTGTAYRYRVVLSTKDTSKTPILEKIKFELINSQGEKTTWNPLNFFGQRVEAATSVVSRASWGCPEPTSSPNWSPEYSPVRKIILHHTASQNNPADPSADVRAIWYYHANTLGWGDIGYNFVADQNGRIYEGRYGGNNVIAGHAKYFNTGSMGVALLGDFSSVGPAQQSLQGLTTFLGEKAYDYGVNPLGGEWGYRKDTSGNDISPSVYQGNVDGHNVYNQTSCPGTISGYMGTIRSSSNAVYVAQSPREYVVTTPVTLSNSNPAIGETVTASYRIENTSSSPVTFGYIGVGARMNGTSSADIGWQQNVTVAANGYYDVSVQRVYTEVGSYNYWASYMLNGTFYRALPQSNQSVSGGFNTRWPNIFATTMITVNPSSPIAGQNANYKVTIYNGESKRINFANLGIAGRNTATGASADIGWLSNSSIAGYGTVTLDINRTLPVGRYYLWSSLGIGSKFNNLWDGGGLNRLNIRVI